VKIGDLIYCHPYARCGVIIELRYQVRGEAVFSVLWQSGQISQVGETFIEVISESR